MKTKKRFIPIFALIIPLLVLAIGCDISTNGTKQTSKPLAIKMQVQSSATPNSVATSVAKKSSTTQAIDSLTQVKLLVDKLELKNSNETEGQNNDSQGDHQDSVKFKANNLVVDLPLDGSKVILSTANVPEGAYNKFEMEVDEPDHDSDVEDDDLGGTPTDTTRNSVVVKGFYNGTAFTYKSQVSFELEMELKPPLVVSTTSNSVGVKVVIDPYSWFKDANGSDLDPNDPANQAQIDQNIKNSLGAEEDHGQQDEQGNDDGGGDGGDD